VIINYLILIVSFLCAYMSWLKRVRNLLKWDTGTPKFNTYCVVQNIMWKIRWRLHLSNQVLKKLNLDNQKWTWTTELGQPRTQHAPIQSRTKHGQLRIKSRQMTLQVLSNQF